MEVVGLESAVSKLSANLLVIWRPVVPLAGMFHPTPLLARFGHVQLV